jgi:hypothetical protein
MPGFAVFEDDSEAASGFRTFQINGVAPDVFARDTPLTMAIVGEAKTSSDLLTARSRHQIRKFLEYLDLQPKGLFLLAVPFGASATARGILRMEGRGLCLKMVTTTILDQIIP